MRPPDDPPNDATSGCVVTQPLVFPGEALYLLEQRKALPTVLCPNVWPKVSVSVIIRLVHTSKLRDGLFHCLRQIEQWPS